MATEVEVNYQKIASMIAAGVPQVQIAEVMNMSEGRISQIKEDEKFQEFLAIEIAKRYEVEQEINEGWDEVERKALKIVTDTLKYNRSPDFALKAAMVANRATRKGVNGNQPLPANMGNRVVINLNQNFVGKLQNLSVHTNGSPSQVGKSLRELIHENSQKRSNLLAPGQVKKLLLEDNKVPGDILSDVDFSGELEVVNSG